MIFGSQIEAVAKANIVGGTTVDELRRLFDTYKVALPDFHGKRTFEQWFGFLTDSGLVGVSEGVVRPTPAGIDFLHYILNQGLPYQKQG
jgi:hypothetical protein